MKSRILLLTIFLLLLNFIRCGCPEPGVFYYSWNEIELTYNRCVSHEDGSWTPWPTDQNDYRGLEFGFSIQLQTEVLAEAGYRIDFSNSAAAWSKCEPDVYKPKLKITDFNIYTLNEFDNEHPENSDITNYFYSGNFSETNTLYYLNNEFSDLYKVMDFRLNNLPSIGTAHKFKLEFVLENGTKITSETKEVTLLPE
jgi:hypothetical protein